MTNRDAPMDFLRAFSDEGNHCEERLKDLSPRLAGWAVGGVREDPIRVGHSAQRYLLHSLGRERVWRTSHLWMR